MNSNFKGKTIGYLVKRYGVSRSTLLYYDKIGLLVASAKSQVNYRLYSNEDLKRMDQIVIYKNAGLSLNNIMKILDSHSNQSSVLLEQRLAGLNDEVIKIKTQQEIILKLLGTNSKVRHSELMSKQQWVEILRNSGMDDKAMHQWHVEFERSLPDAHTAFLISLGIEQQEILSIKKSSM